ncbi:MAG: hypothetical protein OQK48_09120 [Sulfurimonas sp.]|uniref:hypothetical protein n=1 Tax=Sulfurimonas sp. TaxID=2022749 RepID=UPI002629E7BC|nr:hypothetical protein [Sulfurimonas sp.]MCW8896200.1 hypothetical protein [Sulfurimonas sp.]MCW8955085.1 hypothetical protein [Sulfurimonas sp.]MCW9067221.1 hypothetical protein [Sulfurimonas sp.]
MKNIKLLLGVVVFLGLGLVTANAQGMKCGSGKCGASMKSSKIKDETNKRDSKKVEDSKKSSEFESYQKWNKEYSKDKHERGVISTH